TIEAEAAMRQLGYSSKLNADATFLDWLFKLGRERAQLFLEQHRDKIGRESSTDIVARFL
ncbi:MAG: patatin-like phospholipase family protein, partial [Geminicoccaceae bacterium]